MDSTAGGMKDSGGKGASGEVSREIHLPGGLKFLLTSHTVHQYGLNDAFDRSIAFLLLKVTVHLSFLPNIEIDFHVNDHDDSPLVQAQEDAALNISSMKPLDSSSSSSLPPRLSDMGGNRDVDATPSSQKSQSPSNLRLPPMKPEVVDNSETARNRTLRASVLGQNSDDLSNVSQVIGNGTLSRAALSGTLNRMAGQEDPLGLSDDLIDRSAESSHSLTRDLMADTHHSATGRKLGQTTSAGSGSVNPSPQAAKKAMMDSDRLLGQPASSWFNTADPSTSSSITVRQTISRPLGSSNVRRTLRSMTTSRSPLTPSTTALQQHPSHDFEAAAGLGSQMQPLSHPCMPEGYAEVYQRAHVRNTLSLVGGGEGVFRITSALCAVHVND